MSAARDRFDVVVVGGGHAGCEAAAASARYGAKTALVTHRFDRVGEMSCNPAIGGLGKGHLVREVDALDGLMGRWADAAGIQFRLLNRSKGPAVRGPRAQIDRQAYRRAAQAELSSYDNLTILEGAVEDLLFDGGCVSGVRLEDGREVQAAAVVLATGTFLNGVIFRGAERVSAGRQGDPAANGLGARLYDSGLAVGRLKTGTPPRLDGRSIDWAAVERQDGDAEPVGFSYLSKPLTLDQVACGVTTTTPEGHEIIRRSLGESAVYGGRTVGKGPRYCPSIEDKVVRFADRDAHQIFLEPEGRETTTVYPNGISTSISPAAQDAFLHSIPGLGAVRVEQYGYAIEYDFIDPRGLQASLETRRFPGLYFAGQINGTTGYEEAAAQGLIAGLNAARATAGATPLILGRDEAYIGVMIDDLVNRGVSEPYRMFTSRAEFRLTLRADNADQRLTPAGVRAGVVGSARATAFGRKLDELTRARSYGETLSLTPGEATGLGIAMNNDGRRRTLAQLLAYPGVDVARLTAIWPALGAWSQEVVEQIETEAAYAGYLDRQAADVATFRKDENLPLPTDLDYHAVGGLSLEVREKLDLARPATLGAAGRVEGVTPGALTALLGYVRRAAA